MRSVPAVVGPVVEARGPVVALIAVEGMEVSSRVVLSVTENVSAVEGTGPTYELADPWLKTGSVDEVRSSAVDFSAILSVVSVIHVGPVGLVELVSEVTVSVAE